MSSTIDYHALGQQINDVEFDTVFYIDDATMTPHNGALVINRSASAPEVANSETDDVEIWDPHWQAITGMTGQYGYHGAVMHPSEFIGAGIARLLVEDYPAGTLFAVVEVRDDDGNYPEGDPIGWALVYRTFPD